MVTSRSPRRVQNRQEVVRCGVTHAAVIAALHARCFDDAWDTASVAGMLSTPGTLGLIAQSEKVPLGFILFRVAGGEGEILSLGVIPSARGHGAAGCLLDAALQEAVARGAETLFLEVAADNLAASRLYLSRGFREVGRRPRYYRRGSDGTAADALILRGNLSR